MKKLIAGLLVAMAAQSAMAYEVRWVTIQQFFGPLGVSPSVTGVVVGYDINGDGVMRDTEFYLPAGPFRVQDTVHGMSVALTLDPGFEVLLDPFSARGYAQGTAQASYSGNTVYWEGSQFGGQLDFDGAGFPAPVTFTTTNPLKHYVPETGATLGFVAIGLVCLGFVRRFSLV
jgi:hypothetical protein